VGVGALIAGFVIGVVASRGWAAIRENLLLGIVYILVVVLVTLVIYNLYKKRQMKLQEQTV
jgi:F0F1-type ATP synthase membrane subunit c/vacuolar-type H+-ATPase subunit K